MPIEGGPKPPSGPKPSKISGKKAVSISAVNHAVNAVNRLKKTRSKVVDGIDDDDEGIMPYTQAMGPGKHALLLNTDNIKGMLPSPERSPSKNNLFGGFSIDSLVAMSSPVSTVSIVKDEAVFDQLSVVDDLAQPPVNSVNEPTSVASAGSIESLSPLKLPVTAQLKVIEKVLPGVKIDRNMRRSIMMAMQDMNYWDEAEEKELDKLDYNEAQRKAILLASKLTTKNGKGQPASSTQANQRGKKTTKVSFSESQSATAANNNNNDQNNSTVVGQTTTTSPRKSSIGTRAPIIPSSIKVIEEETRPPALLDPQDQAIVNIAGKLNKKKSPRTTVPHSPTHVASSGDHNSAHHSSDASHHSKGVLRSSLKKVIHAVKDIVTGKSHNQTEDDVAVVPHSSASPRSAHSPKRQQLTVNTAHTPTMTGRKHRPGKKDTAHTPKSAAIHDIVTAAATATVEEAMVVVTSERSPSRSPSRAVSISPSTSPTRGSMQMMNSRQSMTRSSTNMNSTNSANSANSEIMLAMAAAVAAVNASGLNSSTSSTVTSNREAFDKEMKEQVINRAVSILVNLHNNPPPSPLDKLSTVSLSSSTTSNKSTNVMALNSNSSNRKDLKAVLIRKYSSGIVERGLKRAKLSFERAALDNRIQTTKLHRLQEKRIIIIQRAWHRYLGRKCCHRILSIGRTSIKDKIAQEIRDLDEFRMRVARRRIREEMAFQQWKGVQAHKPTFPLTRILEEKRKKTLIRVNSSGVALTTADNDLFKQDEQHLRPDLAPFSDHINATIRESLTNVYEIMHKKRQQVLVQQQEEIRRQQRVKEFEESGSAIPFNNSNAVSPSAAATYRRDSSARMEMLMLGATGSSTSAGINIYTGDPNRPYHSSTPSSVAKKGSVVYPSARGDDIKQLTPRQASIAAHLTPTSLPQRQQSYLSAASPVRRSSGNQDALSVSLSMINTSELIAPRPPTAQLNWEEMARVDNTPSIQEIREEKKYKSPAYKMLEQLCGLTEEDIAKHRMPRPQSVAGVVSPRNPLTTSSFIFM